MSSRLPHLSYGSSFVFPFGIGWDTKSKRMHGLHPGVYGVLMRWESMRSVFGIIFGVIDSWFLHCLCRILNV